LSVSYCMKCELRNEPYGHYKLKSYRKVLYNLAQRLPANFICKKLGLVLRKLVLQNKLRVIDADPLGFKLRFYPLDNLGDRFMLFLPQFYEKEEFELIAEILKEDSVFVDIGANAGVYSLVAAKQINSRGKIIAIEPNPLMVERFKTNLRFNNSEDLVEILQNGVADKAGEFHLAIDAKNMGGSSIINDYGGEKIKIQCYPLLELLERRIDKIDILKIDVEGADALVMNVFLKTAPKNLFPRYIMIETPDNLDVESFGYQIRKKLEQNTIYELANSLFSGVILSVFLA
jgi:FkbM family methyltransferase